MRSLEVELRSKGVTPLPQLTDNEGENVNEEGVKEDGGVYSNEYVFHI